MVSYVLDTVFNKITTYGLITCTFLFFLPLLGKDRCGAKFPGYEGVFIGNKACTYRYVKTTNSQIIESLLLAFQ